MEKYTDIRFYCEKFNFLAQHKIPLEAKANVYGAEKIRFVCEFEAIRKRSQTASLRKFSFIEIK